ncbi:MAG TPA: iron ABC transporter permease [Actinomycetes bacterium]|nr:iron ABC transporter permease [Actinomycetes bacterium]
MLPSLLAVLVALLPVVYLFVRASEAGPQGWLEVLARPRTWELVGNTLLLAVLVTAATLIGGVPTAWLLARAQLRGRAVWAALMALPLAVPSYVAAFVWVSGPLRLSGLFGAWMVLTLSTMPLVILPTVAAFRRGDRGHEEVARGLGLGPWRTAWRVTIPQALPAASAGALLAFLYVLFDFGAVSILRYETLTRAVFATYRASFDRSATATLALLLVVLTVAAVAAEQLLRGRARKHRVGAGAPRPLGGVSLGRWAPVAYGWLSFVAVLGVGVPAASLTYYTVIGRQRSVDFPELLGAMSATVWLSLLGAAVTVLLAIPVGVLLARYPGRRAMVVEQLSYAGHALPGIVVGLGLVFFALTVAPGLYQTTAIVVLAYAVLFLPKAIGATRTAVASAPPVLDDVARSLGRSSWGAIRSVTLPLAAPGVLAGGLLVLLTAMKELPATLILRPTGVDTLATELWTRTTVGAYSAAAPFAAALVIVAAIPASWLARASDRVSEEEL